MKYKRLLVTGGDTLANESHMDRVVFRAAIRLARQERLIGDLAQQQDPRAAGSLLRIMRESLELLQAHRLGSSHTRTRRCIEAAQSRCHHCSPRLPELLVAAVIRNPMC